MSNTPYDSASEMMGHLGDLVGKIWNQDRNVHVILSGVSPRAINLHHVENHFYNLDERNQEIGRYALNLSLLRSGDYLRQGAGGFLKIASTHNVPLLNNRELHF